MDTTSIDNAAMALARRAYYIRPVGTDGFRIHHQATLKKVVNDRRSSLDETRDVRPALRKIIQEEFERGKTLPWVPFPADSTAVNDSPKLTLVLLDPELEWSDGLREKLGQWTRQRGSSDRLYPAAPLWCLKKPGKELQDKVEVWLAWKAVEKEIRDKSLDADLDAAQRDRVLADVRAEVRTAEQDVRSEVWASYRYLVLLDPSEPDGLRCIDMGSGDSCAGQTLCSQVIAAVKGAGLLNDSPGAGYLDRRWPPALKESGAWSLQSLRQAFLTGALERLLDVDTYLRDKLPAFIERGDFGLASGQRTDGTYERLWWKEPVDPSEIAFEPDVYLLKKARAQALKAPPKPKSTEEPPPGPREPRIDVVIDDGSGPTTGTPPPASPEAKTRKLTLSGTLPPEIWNRLGTRLIPKLKQGTDLQLQIEFSLTVSTDLAAALTSDLEQVLTELQLADKVKVQAA